MVDADPQNLIGESGRVLTGYREHKCPEAVVPWEGVTWPAINPGGAPCTQKNMDNQKCHAFNNGECMNGFVCKPVDTRG
jgi:hypothetical protein